MGKFYLKSRENFEHPFFFLSLLRMISIEEFIQSRGKEEEDKCQSPNFLLTFYFDLPEERENLNLLYLILDSDPSYRDIPARVCSKIQIFQSK